MAHYFGAAPRKMHDDRLKMMLIAGGSAVCCLTSLVLLLFPIKSAPAVNTPAPAPVEVAMSEVFVPRENITAHTPLSPALFEAERVPQNSVRTGAVISYEELRGSYSRTLLLKGQPLYREYLTNIRPWEHIIKEIPDGYRAVTIPVNSVNGVGGWTWPGMSVDIQWITKINGKDALKPLVQNAKVLAAGTDMTASSDRPRSYSDITLSVTAEDADKITLALKSGQISLVLRGEGPPKGEKNRTITSEELFGATTKEPQAEYKGTLEFGGQRYYVKPDGTYVKPDSTMVIPTFRESTRGPLGCF